ncbi:MBL fold metallo-hydrolase [Clostridium colicanis]|uniref:Hydroxyacylglutathione hydrolase n=1 Tax=Clostridium colicanis DSM 13634 TaxID=1121305 RepID=A0A151AL27_9CLOT|nr:MBL fold metallo-hydrolase [Clostridium colicanis]KYH28359.1 hydroxyacylglutathione hydrolase [Clostridium colicanis DSM 13634]
MKIKEIKGNTFCIDTGMTYIPFYKLNDEEIIMLDSGWKEGEREGIESLLEKNKLKVAAIICSHAHIDHIGNNAYFKEKYNCVIAMSVHEAHICSSAINLKSYYSTQSLSEVEQHLGHMVCETDIMISDEQNKICVCGVKFDIVHTPGHSPAHISIITPDNVAYVADALISYEVMEGAKMPYAFILREDLKSKEKLYNLKCSKYVIAHKGIYDDITKLISDNIKFYKQRAESIYELMEDNMTLEEILKVVIKSFDIGVKSVQKYIIIERMLRSYVEYLTEIGKVKLVIEDRIVRYKKC